MKINRPGRVWIPGDKGRFKPFSEFREIRKGKDKGKIEVIIQPSSPKKVVVEKSAIKYFPTYEGDDDGSRNQTL